VRQAEEDDAPFVPSLEHARLYETELDFVWRTLRSLGAAEQQIEDLAHDVFERAFNAWASYDARRPLRPWLFGIAFRVLASHRRAAWQFRERDRVSEEWPDEEPLPEQIFSGEEERRLLQAALGKLDPERKALLVMHYLEQWSWKDIAEVFPVPLNTLRSRLRLARRDLMKALDGLQR
jgi:RNA polymerase sigma-70 factor (ECF subfamily)